MADSTIVILCFDPLESEPERILRVKDTMVPGCIILYKIHETYFMIYKQKDNVVSCAFNRDGYIHAHEGVGLDEMGDILDTHWDALQTAMHVIDCYDDLLRKSFK